jgi:hypothetical protein
MLSTSSSLCISKSPCPSLLCASQPALPLVQGTARSAPSSSSSPSLPVPVPAAALTLACVEVQGRPCMPPTPPPFATLV